MFIIDTREKPCCITGIIMAEVYCVLPVHQGLSKHLFNPHSQLHEVGTIIILILETN